MPALLSGSSGTDQGLGRRASLALKAATATATRAARRCRAASCRARRRACRATSLNNATVAFNQARSGTYAGNMIGQRRPADQRHRHGDPDRHQQLHRRHHGVGRHPAGQHGEPAGQHPQQRRRWCSTRPAAAPLCRRHVGHRRHDPAGRRRAAPSPAPAPAPAPTTVNASTLVVNGSLASDGHA